MCDVISPEGRGGEKSGGAEASAPVSEEQKEVWCGEESQRGAACRAGEREEGGKARSHQLRRDASPFHPSFASCFASTCAVSHAASPGDASLASGFFSSLSPRRLLSRTWQAPGRQSCGPSPGLHRSLSESPLTSEKTLGRSCGLPHVSASFETSPGESSAFDSACREVGVSPSFASSLSFFSVHSHTAAPLESSGSHSQLPPHAHEAPATFASLLRSSSLPPSFAESQTGSPFFLPPASSHAAAQVVPGGSEFDGVCTPECRFFVPGSPDFGAVAWTDGAGEAAAKEDAGLRDSGQGEAVQAALYSSLDAQRSWAEDEGGESAFCEPPEEAGRLGPRDVDAFFCAWCPSFPTPYGDQSFLPEGEAPVASFEEFGYEKSDNEEGQSFSSFGNRVAVAPTLLHVYASSPGTASCSLSPSHTRTDAPVRRRDPSPSTTPSFSQTVSSPFSVYRPPTASAAPAPFTSAVEYLDAQGVYTLDDGVHSEGRAFSVPRASGEGSVHASPALVWGTGASRGGRALSASAPSWEELQRGALRQSFEETASTETTGETHREDKKLSSQLCSRASPFYPASSRFLYADASLPLSGASLASASVSAAASFPLHAEIACSGETERLRKPFQFSPYSSPFSPSAPSGVSLQRRNQDRTPRGDLTVAFPESAGRRSPLNGDSFENASTESFETGVMSQTLFLTKPRIRCSSFSQSSSLASSSPSPFSASSFSSSLSSTSPAFSPSSASSFSSSLSSTSPAFSPSSAASFSSSLSSTSPAFSPSSAASFSSSLSSTSPAFSPSSAASFSSSLSSTSPAFSPSSASSLSSSLSSSAPAFSSFSASSFSSSLSSSAPAFSPCSAWASSSFAALEDAFSTSPMHAKGGGSPQPRAGREGTRGAWGVRSLRFYEDIALVLSSLSSASEDETSDELISNGDGSQEGAESEGADEEETKETRSLPRVPHVRKTQLSPRSSKPGHRPSSSFLVPPLAASSCSCPSSPSLCSSSPSLACSSLACSSLASSSLSPSLARSLPCSPTLFMRAHAPDASSTSPSLRVAGRAGQKRERQAIPWRFMNFPVWPPESRAWAREIREAHLPRLLNPTAFAGIEKSGKTERDFVHAVAQAVFFAPLLKGVLARHQCDRHACVACELGFLLHMLDLARKEEDPFRRVCQSTNLQRLLRDLPRMRRARVFHSCFPSDGNEVARGTFSALARRTRIFCGLLLEHLHEDLKDSSSQVASSFSSPIDFLFHLRDTPGSSAERGDEVDVASEFFLPLRYPHKEISETSCSSSSSLSCSSSAAASFSSCSSTDPGDAPRSPASSLSFAQVLEHSLRVYGVRKRETKRQRESVPCAGSSDGGLREEAAAVSASSRDTVTGEERSVREEKRSREQDIGGRETRNGEEKEQDESPLSAYPPLLFIDSNLESEADAAHWRARVRGRRAPRGVCTPEEAAREGGEEGKRSRPAFLCEEFWVKLQSSGEAGETETLPRVRQERFPGAVHYVLSAVLFCVRSPHSFASSPPRRKSVSLGPGCLPLDSVSHTREALSPPPLVTSSVSSSFALSSSSLPLSPSFSFSTTPSSTSQPSLPSPFSFAVAWSSAASVRRSSSSSAFSSSRSASSPLLPSGAPLSAPLFLSSPGVSASHACLSSSTGEQSNARRSEERLSGSHASCRTRGRQAAASSEEAREVTGGQAKGNSRPADPREAEEERLLLFVRVPESYLETHDVSPSGGPDEFDETRGDSSSSSSLSKVSLGMSGVCTAHARGERSQAGRTEAGRAVDAKISQWGEGEEGDLDASGGEERVVLEKTSSCGAGRLSLNRGGDNDKARKEGKEEEREEERCTAAWSERRKHSSKGTRWLLINDHVLAYVKETTVLDFSRSWKLPVLLQFTRRDCLDASSASSGELREASRTCEGEKGDSSGFAASSVDSEGRSTYRRFFGESGCRREAADALRETTSRAGRTEKPGRLEEPEELFASSVAFHLFQADENISLRPLAAKTPTTFLPLTHDELVALQRRKASPSTTHFGGNTRRGNDFSSPAFSSSSSTPSASALSSSTSPASSPSSSASSPSASPASSASSSPSSSSCFLCGPSCLRVDVERDGSAKRRGTEGRAGTEAIEVARCSVSAERRLPTAVGEAEKIEFNGEGREGSNAKDEEERHTVEPRVEEKKREAKGAATSARKTEHSEDLSSNEEDAYAPVFTPLFSPGVSPEGRDRGAEEKEKPMGWLVALDAEFVAEDLEKEEAVPLVNEFHRVKPVSTQSLALARVSVLRGEGPQAGVPFIDHYVHFKVAPKDYLTRFSGLRPGDLDLHASQFWLSTKKAIHQKLRYLVDAGCVFVGHGLSQDFRIINLFVPSSQIIDTVELFRLPGRRLLSLKFLAAHLLDLRIQQTTHDSVEDARSALLLYRRYNELRRNGTLEQCIQHLYRIGYSTKWSVPDSPAVLPLSFHCPFSSAHSSLPSSVSFPSSLPLSSSGPVCSRLSPEALPFVLRCGAGRRQQLPSSPPAVGLEREAEEK